MLGHTMTVRSRLKVLIAQRNLDRAHRGEDPLTVREIAEACRLAPSVITGLTANRSKRVDFDTLNALCGYFGVQPGELLEYVPDADDASEASNG
jgi:putative transcriptional regulator